MFRSLFRYPQGARSFLVKVTEFKVTKSIKGPLWQCGSIRLVCMYGVLCRDVSWTAYSNLSEINERLTVIVIVTEVHALIFKLSEMYIYSNVIILVRKR